MPKGLCPKCGSQSLAYHCYCRKCHGARQIEYYKKNPKPTCESAKRRTKQIRDLIKYAKSVPCSDCGILYPFYVMDFDHVYGEKKFNLSIAANARKQIPIVLEEISKCDVVCANCHRERTWKRILLPLGVTKAQGALTSLDAV